MGLIQTAVNTTQHPDIAILSAITGGAAMSIPSAWVLGWARDWIARRYVAIAELPKFLADRDYATQKWVIQHYMTARQIEQKFETVEKRIEKRFDDVEQRIERRFDDMDRSLAIIREKLFEG